MNKDKWNKIKKIIIAILIPLIIGGISAFLTKDAMNNFKNLNQPILSPPSWLFPIAWTILYILMGLSSYFIYENKNVYLYEEREKSLLFYGVQLVFNFLWSIIFFNMKQYVFAFIWLLVLLILVILLMINAKKVSKTSFYLLIPYLLWIIFAGYLNIMIAILN